MKRFITIEDVIIYDKLISNDQRNAGYNIGDLLNMPSLHNIWNQMPHADESMLQKMHLIGSNYENSILNIYCKNREHTGEIVPNIPLIQKAVDQFTNEWKHTYSDMLSLIQTPTTLCVHVRNGDLDTEEVFIKRIVDMATNYTHVILMTGVHLDEAYKNNDMKKANIINTINSIFNTSSPVLLSSSTNYLVSAAGQLLLADAAGANDYIIISIGTDSNVIGYTSNNISTTIDITTTLTLTSQSIINWNISGIYKPLTNNEQLTIKAYVVSSTTGAITLYIKTFMATAVLTSTS